MRIVAVVRTAAALFCILPMTALAQSVQPAVSVPRLINIGGTFSPVNGPPAAVEEVTLAVYAEERGGTPLWQETQSVQVDAAGHYTLLLGATHAEGVPLELFASGEARWLGVTFARPGEVEGPRRQITSVPYALRASNADTLGGRPASAYLLSPQAAGGESINPTSTVASGADVANAVLPGSTGYLAKYVNATDVGASAVYEGSGRVGVGTANPFDSLHVQFTNTNGGFTGYAVQNLGNTATSYSGTLFYDQFGALGQFQGFNNVTHEYRINNIASTSGIFNGSINFMIAGTSRVFMASSGNVGMGTTAPTLGKLQVEGGAGVGVRGNSSNSYGVHGVSTNNIGVRGDCTGCVGVYGLSTSNDGVRGESLSGFGVSGASATGFGVNGSSDTGWGVHGVSNSSAGVKGDCGGCVGVHGFSTNNDGVRGESNSGFGVSGISSTNNGMTGTSFSGYGVSGISTTNDAVRGTSQVSSVVAGFSTTGIGAYGRSIAGPGVRASSSSSNLVEGWNDGGQVFHIDNAGTYVAGSDFAEALPVVGDRAGYEAGDVLIASADAPGHIDVARRPYDPRVVGIYSTRPGMLGAEKQGATRVDPNDVPVAIVGIVPTKVSAANGPLRVGDLLTTSGTPGHAMRCVDPVTCFGAVVGKALEPLTEGTGVIRVLVMLR